VEGAGVVDVTPGLKVVAGPRKKNAVNTPTTPRTTNKITSKKIVFKTHTPYNNTCN